MFPPTTNKAAVHTKALSTQGSSALVPVDVDLNKTYVDAQDNVENGGFLQAESIIRHSQKLQDDLHMLGLKIKQHEDNLNLLKTQRSKLDDSILDLQVIIGQYQSSSTPKIGNADNPQLTSDEEVNKQILQHEKSAAGILCQLKIHHGTQASHLALMKDVVGVVATLGKVEDDNLSRPYAGNFVVDDPQKKLDFLNPKLPNGECPAGFLGFAVNMINVDSSNLFCVTPSGYGLRESLFYNLFSRLQVYKTRAEMMQALPCISDGALSLDGGMIRSNGVFSLGNREDVDVRFPRPGGPLGTDNHCEIERQMKDIKWKKEKILEDTKREQTLLGIAKFNFNKKKNDFLKFLAQSSSYATQVQTTPDRFISG